MKNMKIIKKTLFFLVLSLFSILLVSCKKPKLILLAMS